MSLRERFTPQIAARQKYLGDNAFVNAIVAIVSAAAVGGLAVSRADNHRLSATAVALIVGVGPVLYSCYVYLLGLFGALADTTDGRVVPDDSVKVARIDGDPLSPRRLWLGALQRMAVVALWSAGLAVLVLAAMNRRQAGFLIVFVAILAAEGASSVLGGLASNALGTQLGLAKLTGAQPRAARKRAWRELALPLSIILGVVNAAFTWVLFHDYTVGQSLGPHVLTEQQVLADVLVLALFNVGGAVLVCGRAGRAEAKLGLVTFEDPDEQLPPPRSLIGPQGLVYAVIATILVSSLVKFLLPALPNIAEAMVARGVLSGFLVFVAGGMAYIRSAANATAEAKR